jgi:hypothetical protein
MDDLASCAGTRTWTPHSDRAMLAGSNFEYLNLNSRQQFLGPFYHDREKTLANIICSSSLPLDMIVSFLLRRTLARGQDHMRYDYSKLRCMQCHDNIAYTMVLCLRHWTSILRKPDHNRFVFPDSMPTAKKEPWLWRFAV